MSDHTKRRYVRQSGTCTVEACERSPKARGWCLMHYKRWRTHGTPDPRLRGEIVDGKRVCASCNQDTPLEDVQAAHLGCNVRKGARLVDKAV